ncbi:SurA N-terminal domain-containing protein [Pseudomonas typographi]|uniref:Periplasmic chaperone PpiD n=1 Tax=Pseudomonas typographi TaxID=2715964 RepID=A0ABR7Z4G3_9PSED|nr:SurA N-terminal domain-containing protein [Pseudomonas typographi]MBD1553207.1 peptidylprolyl isomerase [Pseudomonas typographi]MBD1588087.1 peptidylprolyl isomerase [Pseudomonas typographi]MBD1600379.1 peptidylprolyl isomerase [Pseudomonas typographi]
MLQNIRDNSQGWIAKTIIGLIVVLMALTGFDAIFRATSHSQDAAKVNGDEISQADLSQAVEMQRRQLMQQLGKDFDPSLLDDKRLREAALKGLIERKLLLQGAVDAKFSFSEAALDQVILQTPEFQVDGKFDADRFDQVIRQMGFSRLQFRQMLTDEMLIAQLRAGLAGSSFVTDADMLAFARLDKQTRDFASLSYKADAAAQKVSDDEVKAYYDEHAKEFMSPDQVVIDYVELKKSAFFDQVKVSDEDLQAQYQKEIANLAEQRRAAHILIEVNDKVSDAEAKGKIEAIAQRLAKGEDFATVAKQTSQDPGSADNGGDLGYSGKGVYDPAFEQALYGLKQGEVSQPVRTPYGWHLIKLLGVQAPQVPSLASLKDKISRELKSQQVEQLYVDAAKKLEDSAFEASDLSQPAQELGLKVQTSQPFGREGGSEGVTANRQVVQAAFSTEVLDEGANSNAIELDPETTVVVRAKEHRKPAQLSLEAVSEPIRKELAREKAADAAKAKGEALIAGLRDGKVALATSQDGQAWKVSEAATRNQDGVDPKVLQQVFRMPKPANGKPTFAGITLSDGSYTVIRLNGVNEGPEPTDEEKNQYRQFLASRKGQQDFASYRQLLESKAKIERY